VGERVEVALRPVPVAGVAGCSRRAPAGGAGEDVRRGGDGEEGPGPVLGFGLGSGDVRLDVVGTGDDQALGARGVIGDRVDDVVGPVGSGRRVASSVGAVVVGRDGDGDRVGAGAAGRIAVDVAVVRRDLSAPVTPIAAMTNAQYVPSGRSAVRSR